jgi:hypothetical protein
MNSPSGNDTLELFFDPRKGLDLREDDKTLQRLSGRSYIDSCRISELERQLHALRIQLYLLVTLTLILVIGLSLLLVRLPWHF